MTPANAANACTQAGFAILASEALPHQARRQAEHPEHAPLSPRGG
jgi:hypothetical protein